MLLQLLFLSLSPFLFQFVASQGYTCSENTVVTPPLDITKPYYYPNDWNESMPPAKYNPSQNCNWKINILEGMYATVTFYKNSNYTGSFTAWYSNNNVVGLSDNDHNPYIFTSKQFQVSMQVQEEPGEFSFQVIWTNYPLNSCHTYIQLDSSSPWPIAPSDCFTTFSAPNRVMLVGFNTKQESDEVLLRQSAVFEGRSSDGVYLGNLWDLLVRQIVSNSNELTVYTFGLFEQINYVLYMGVDSKAIQDVQLFRGLNCGDNENTPCLLYLPSNAISAVATVSALGTDTVDYLLPFDKFPYDGTMKIYEGKMTDENLLATVNQTDYKYKFPMAVKNSLKIYYLDKGSVQIPILSYGYSEARYDIVFPGRFINIHSFNYRQLNEDQYTYEGFGTNSSAVKMYFNLNVKYFDASGPTTYLQVEVIQDGYWVFKERYNSTFLPPNTLTLFGDTIVITYESNGYRTKGFEVDMLCTESTPKTTTPAPTVPSVYTRSAPDSDSTVTTVTSIPTTSTTSRPIPTTTKITAIPQILHVLMITLIWLTL